MIPWDDSHAEAVGDVLAALVNVHSAFLALYREKQAPFFHGPRVSGDRSLCFAQTVIKLRVSAAVGPVRAATA